MEQEIWKVYKEVKGRNFKGIRIYEVSNEGNVKVNGVLVDFSKRKTKGYYKIGGKHLHKIVAELFVPNPHNYKYVDHINSDKYDNRSLNLLWCTQQMNCNNSITKQNMSVTHNKPEVKKKHSEVCKDRCWMTNGIDRIFPKKDKSNYYLALGYHFGQK